MWLHYAWGYFLRTLGDLETEVPFVCLKFEGGSVNPRAIICATIHHIQERNVLYFPKRNKRVWEGTILGTLGFPTKEVPMVCLATPT